MGFLFRSDEDDETNECCSSMWRMVDTVLVLVLCGGTVVFVLKESRDIYSVFVLETSC